MIRGLRVRRPSATSLRRTKGSWFLLLGILIPMTAVAGCPQATQQEGTTSPARTNQSQQAAEVPSGWGDRDALRHCLVSAQTVLADKSEFALVDLRDPSEFARYRIAGAMNLQRTELARSPFFPHDGRTVVLVGDGADLSRLQWTCLALRSSMRTRVQVLAGGIRAWHHAGGALLGVPGALHKPQVIDAPRVRELLRLPGTWVITDTAQPIAGIAGDQSVLVAPSASAAIQELRQSPSPDPVAIVLMFEAPMDRAKWRQALLAASLPEPMFFAAGPDAFGQWFTDHTQMLAQRGSNPGLGCRWN